MSKTIAHYRTDIRTDLKDTAAIWSDAELDRCIERAVSDLTRFRPLEKTLEVTIDAIVTSESFTTPAASDPNLYVDDDDISAIDDGDLPTLTGVFRPDVPRPVLVTVTDADASITQLVIIVKGYDVDNSYIEEYFYLEGGLVQTGNKYFALVTEVEIDEITGEAAGDKLDVGTGAANGVFVQLANPSIKFSSEAITSFALDTDYIMNYARGRIAMKSGGGLSVATAYTIGYTKSRIDIDLASIIDDLIRIDRVEYPTGDIQQNFANKEIWGSILTLTGDANTQVETTDSEHVLVKYYGEQSPPNDQSRGSYPEFLDSTVQLVASAYALFIKALQYEHAAVTSITAVDAALINVTKYLNNNSQEDAVEMLKNITDDVAELRTKIRVAADAMATDLAAVITVDLDQATVGASGLLETGDDTIDKLNDGMNVPALYAEYSRTRTQVAGARLQTAAILAQEVAGRLNDASLYLGQSAGYAKIAEDFLAQSNQYQTEANSNLVLADRWRTEAIERRNEAFVFWANPTNYAASFVSGARSQTQ